MFWKVLSSEKDNSPAGRGRYFVVAEELEERKLVTHTTTISLKEEPVVVRLTTWKTNNKNRS